MAKRGLPLTRLPKGTRQNLVLLLRRVADLEAVQVRMPRYGVQALARTVEYLAANNVEGRPVGGEQS